MTVAVITPAANRRLATVAAVRADLGALVASATDEQVRRWIDIASARAASYCRRAFGRETVRERLDGRSLVLSEDRLGLRLDRAPVAAIVALSVDGTAIDPSGFAVEGSWLYLVGDSAQAPWAARSVVVDYTAGWVLPDDDDHNSPPAGALMLPADVESAVILLVGVAASSAGRDPTMKSETVDGVGRQDFYVPGATSMLGQPDAEAALSRYRRALTA